MFVLLFSIICIVGFFVEVLGVATGAIFGVYHYGEALGMQGLNVPFIIGVNWYLLAMATYEAFHYKRIHKLMRALLSAALMTFIDVLIEPSSLNLTDTRQIKALEAAFGELLRHEYQLATASKGLLTKMKRLQESDTAAPVPLYSEGDIARVCSER
jgi:hypothetical protein